MRINMFYDRNSLLFRTRTEMHLTTDHWPPNVTNTALHIRFYLTGTGSTH